MLPDATSQPNNNSSQAYDNRVPVSRSALSPNFSGLRESTDSFFSLFRGNTKKKTGFKERLAQMLPWLAASGAVLGAFFLGRRHGQIPMPLTSPKKIWHKLLAGLGLLGLGGMGTIAVQRATKSIATNGTELSYIRNLVHVPIGDRLSPTDLFGPNLKENDSIQQSGYSCYVLSAIDNILQHPQAKDMLNTIEVYKVSHNSFSVKFHNHEKLIITADELKASDVAKSDYLGIPLLEQAYLRTLPDEIRFAKDVTMKYGESTHVFEKMLPSALIPSSEGLQEFRANDPDYKEYLQGLIRDVQNGTRISPLLSIGSGKHIRSLRLHASDQEVVRFFEPFEGPKELTIDGFIAKFDMALRNQYHLIKDPLKADVILDAFRNDKEDFLKNLQNLWQSTNRTEKAEQDCQERLITLGKLFTDHPELEQSARDLKNFDDLINAAKTAHAPTIV